jgi:hypothetical protein
MLWNLLYLFMVYLTMLSASVFMGMARRMMNDLVTDIKGGT